MFEKRPFRPTWIIACSALWFAGCAPSLKNNPPREANKQTPGAFPTAQADKGVPAAPPSPAVQSAAQKKWDEFFADPDLKVLIKQALENNQELNIRLQEIIIANSEVMARKGEYQPKVDAGVGAGIEKVGDRTSQGVSDEANGVPKNLGNFAFGVSATWEVDVWKKLRNASKAAALRYLASIEGKNFVVTQIVAEIANSYYELLALDRQVDVLHRNIAIQIDALEVVKLEKQAARVTQLAVQRFEAEVLKNRSRLYDLEQQRIIVQNRINFLLGRYPEPIARDPKKFESPTPDVVGAGLPSDLLANRPDVRQAELELEAAKLDVKSAKAAFYPSLSIDAGVGYQTFNIKHLVATPEALAYNLGGNLTAPLLNRKAIKAAYQTANAQQLQAVFSYERAILQAYTDVANQLSMIENLQKSYDLEKQQVDLLTQSIEVSNVLFQSARADYMEVLLTRRDSLDAEMELIETKKRQLQAMVDVYQALGGGWR
jgi:NodT family efflux transporter outer membrane factor (OMF) lipoprotein